MVWRQSRCWTRTPEYPSGKLFDNSCFLLKSPIVDGDWYSSKTSKSQRLSRLGFSATSSLSEGNPSYNPLCTVTLKWTYFYSGFQSETLFKNPYNQFLYLLLTDMLILFPTLVPCKLPRSCTLSIPHTTRSYFSSDLTGLPYLRISTLTVDDEAWKTTRRSILYWLRRCFHHYPRNMSEVVCHKGSSFVWYDYVIDSLGKQLESLVGCRDYTVVWIICVTWGTT